MISNITTKDEYYKKYAKTIVMDIDDTLSFAKTYTDLNAYAEAEPNLKLIKVMNDMVSEGYTFILHTARGYISCNEDTEKADKKYRTQIEAWLKQWNVPYSSLVFGKPYGILYIDDKAMTPESFINKFHKE